MLCASNSLLESAYVVINDDKKWKSILWLTVGILTICTIGLNGNGHSFAVIMMSLIDVCILAKLVGEYTEVISDNTNEIIGGIMNAGFGNVFELVFCLMCLFKNTAQLDNSIKLMIVGGVIANNLIVGGTSFIAGGLKNGIQHIEQSNIHNSSTTIMVASSVLLSLPAIYTYMNGNTKSNIDFSTNKISTVVAFVLFFLFGLFSSYQVLNCEDEQTNTPEIELKESESGSSIDLEVNIGNNSGYHAFGSTSPVAKNSTKNPAINFGSSESTPLNMVHNMVHNKSRDNVSDISMGSNKSSNTLWEKMCNCKREVAFLVLATAIVSYVCDILTDNLNEFTSGYISPTVMTFCFVAITGAVPEHLTALTASMNGKVMESLTIPTTSSIQLIALIPSILVILSFARGNIFTLVFDANLLTALNISTFFVCLTTYDGQTNWLKGIVLVCMYIAVVTFVCS